MIINHEEPKFIIAALNIPTNEDEDKPYQLIIFLNLVYGGPRYYHLIGPRRTVGYPLGVEFTLDDRLILKYESQLIECWGGWANTTEDQFSQQDVKMMRAVAYGPLLQEPRVE